MFEGVIVDALTKVLGGYVRGLDRESIKVGVWSGNLELAGLQLHSEALATLFETLGVNLPITVRAGKIGSLRVQVPWKNLRSQPIRIIMKEVTVIATPARLAEAQALAMRRMRIKLAKLATDDALREARWNETVNAGASKPSAGIVGGMTSKIVTRVMDNLNIELLDVLVRYEDPVSDESHPIASEVGLSALRFFSADTKWQAVYVNDTTSADMRKMVHLENFYVKYSHLQNRFDEKHKGSLREHLNFLRSDLSDTQHVVSPISGEVRAALLRNAAGRLTQQGANISLDVVFAFMQVTLNEFQYSSLLKLSNEMASFKRKGGALVAPKDARSRWWWALERIVPGFGERRRQANMLTAKGVREWRRRCVKYIALRRSILSARRGGVEVAAQEEELLAVELQEELTTAEIIAMRDAADWLCEREKDFKKLTADSTSVATSAAASTAAKRFVSLFTKQPQADEGVAQQRLGEKDSSAMELSRSSTSSVSKGGDTEQLKLEGAVNLRLGLLLKQMSLLLVIGGYKDSKSPRDIAALEISRLEIGVITRPSLKQTDIDILLGEIRVRDVQHGRSILFSRRLEGETERPDSQSRTTSHAHEHSNGSLYPFAIREAMNALRRSRDDDSATFEPESARQQYLVALKILKSSSPASGEQDEAEIQVEAAIGGLEAVVDGPTGVFVQSCIFLRPEGQRVDAIMQVLSDAARSRLRLIRKRFRKAVAAKQRLPLSVDVFFRAPRVYLPGATPEQPQLLLDFGTISLRTSNSTTTRAGSYTEYSTSVSELSASVSATGAGGNPDMQRIINPVQATLAFQVCDDSSNVTNSGARLNVNMVLPALDLTLSQCAYRRLLKVCKHWSRKMKAADTSNRVHELEHRNDEKRIEPPQLSDEAEPASDLEMKLNLQRVGVELVDGQKKLMVNILAKDTHITVVKRATAVSATFELRSLEALDFSDENACGRPFLLAGEKSDARSAAKLKQSDELSPSLVRFRYKKEVESQQQSISLHILFMECEIVSEVVQNIIGYLFVETSTKKSDVDASPFAAAGTSMKEAAQAIKGQAESVINRSREAFQQRGQLQVETKFDGLRMLVTSRATGDLGSLNVSALSLFIDRRDDFMYIRGRFESIMINNLRTSFAEQRPFLEYRGNDGVNGSTQTDLVSLRENDVDNDYGWSLLIPFVKSRRKSSGPTLKARFPAFRIVFVQHFVHEVQTYISDLNEACQALIRVETDEFAELLPADRQNAAEAIASTLPEHANLSIKCEHMEIMVPRHSKNNHEAVCFTMDALSATNDNATEGYHYAFNLELIKLNTFALYPLSDEPLAFTKSGARSSILPDLDITAKMDYWPRRQARDFQDIASSRAGVSEGLPAIRIRTKPIQGGITLRMCEAEYSVLYFVFTENFIEPSAKSWDELIVQANANFAERADQEGEKFPPLVQLLLFAPRACIELVKGNERPSEQNKLVDLSANDVALRMDMWKNAHVFVDISATLEAVMDRRPQASEERRLIAIPRGDLKSASILKMSFDRPFLRHANVAVVVTEILFVVEVEMYAALGDLLIPGDPLLPTSKRGMDIPFCGRTVVVNLSGICVELYAEEFDTDSRYMKGVSDIVLEVRKSAFTRALGLDLAAKGIALSLCDRETSAEVWPGKELQSNGKVTTPRLADRMTAERSTEQPFLFPTDLLLELGPANNERLSDGRVIHLSSVDALTFRVAEQDIALGQALVDRVLCAKLPQKRPRHPDAMDLADDGSPLSLSLSIATLRLIFTHEPGRGGGGYVPILEARLAQIALQAVLPSILKLRMNLAADLFDAQSGYWVPALEPWAGELAVSTSTQSRSIMFQASQRLDINISPVIIEGVMRLVGAITGAVGRVRQCRAYAFNFESAEQRKNAERLAAERRRLQIASASTMVIRNECGVDLTVRVPNLPECWVLRGDGMETNVEVSAESAMSINRGANRSFALRCFVSLGGGEPRSLSLARTGAHLVPFPPDDAELVWEVSMRGGIPVGTIRTLYSITNNTGVELEVHFGDDVSHIVSAGESISVPLSARGAGYFVRPTKGIYRWSNALWNEQQWSKLMQRMQQQDSSPSSMPSKLPSNPTVMRSTRSLRNWKSQVDSCCQVLRCEPETGAADVATWTAAVEVAIISKPKEWVRLSIVPPLRVENALPRTSTLSFYRRKDSELERLATTHLRPLGTAEIFVPCSISDLWMSVFYRNSAVHGRIEDEDDDEAVNSNAESLSEEGYRVKGRRPYDEAGEDSTLQADALVKEHGGSRPGRFLKNEAFAVPFALAESGAKHVTVPVVGAGSSYAACAKLELSACGGSLHCCLYADIWLRNRSDVALEARVTGSSPALNASVCAMPARPPGTPAPAFATAVGSTVAIRMATSPVAGPQNGIGADEAPWQDLGEIGEITRSVELSDIPRKDLLAKVKAARGKFERSLVVTVRCALWIENATGRRLQWCHESSVDKRGIALRSAVQDLAPGEVRSVHYRQWGSTPALRLRLADMDGGSDWIWSSVVDANRSRSLSVKFYNIRAAEQYIARAQVEAMRGGSRKLIVYAEDVDHPPYMLVNECSHRRVAFHQLGMERWSWVIGPKSQSRYSWDDALASRRRRALSVILIESSVGRNESRTQPFDIVIDEVDDRVIESSPGNTEGVSSPLRVQVRLRGPTKVVTFSDVDLSPLDKSSTSLPAPASTDVPPSSVASNSNTVATVGWDAFDGSKGSPSSKAEAEATAVGDLKSADVQPAPPNVLDVEVYLPSIGVSVVDGTPEELLYLHCSGVRLHLERSGVVRMASVEIQELQADNQLPRPAWPVVLWSPLPRDSLRVADLAPKAALRQFLELRLQINDAQSGDRLRALKGFYCAVQQIELSLDEELALRLWALAQSFVEPMNRNQAETLGRDDGETRLLFSHSKEDKKLLDCVYVEQLLLAPVKLTINLSSSDTPAPPRSGRYYGYIRMLIATFGNVENAEFRLNALQLRHALDTADDLRALVGEFYMSQFNKQKFTFVASNNLIGNPSVLFDHISTGAHDFFVEPYKVKSGAEFLPELYKGGTSFIGNTVGGIVGAVGSIPRALAGSVGSAMADREYTAARSAIFLSGSASSRPSKGVGQGLFRGARSLGYGISSGVSGLVLDPLRGAQEDGAAGFFRGLGKGMMGGVLKPLTGALDLIAEPTMGFRAIMTTSNRNTAAPMRPPRVFVKDASAQRARLVAFNFEHAVGAELLSTVRRRQLVQSDFDDVASTDGRTGNDTDPPLELYVVLARYSAANDLEAMWRTLRVHTRGVTGGKATTTSTSGGSKKISDVSVSTDTGNVADGNEDTLRRLSGRTRLALLTSTTLVVATLDVRVLYESRLADIQLVQGSPRDDSVLLVGHGSSGTDSSRLRWSRLRCGTKTARDELYFAMERVRTQHRTDVPSDVSELFKDKHVEQLRPEALNIVAPADIEEAERLAASALQAHPSQIDASAHRSIRAVIVNKLHRRLNFASMKLEVGRWSQRPERAFVRPAEAILFEVDSGEGMTADIQGSTVLYEVEDGEELEDDAALDVSTIMNDGSTLTARIPFERRIVLNFVNLFLAKKAYFADTPSNERWVVRVDEPTPDTEHATVTYAVCKAQTAVPVALSDSVNGDETDSVASLTTSESVPPAPMPPSPAGSVDGSPPQKRPQVKRVADKAQPSSERMTSESRPSQPTGAAESEDGDLAQLVLLGFSEKSAKRALRLARGDMVAAVDILISQAQKPPK